MDEASSPTPRVKDVVIDTPHGAMRAIVARPCGVEPFHAVIAFPHVGGLTNTMRIMACAASRGGYLCVVPDLYHRLGQVIIDPQSDDEDVVAIRKIAAQSVTDDNAMEDARAVLHWLAAQPDIAGPVCGVIGYGRGGSLALRAASAFPDRVRAAASVLGFGFAPRGRADALATFGRIEGGVYCAFAEFDDVIPRAVHDELVELLAELPLDARVVMHAGARHPYIFPDRAVYDEAVARKDWEAIFAMFALRLGG